jgi:hypothetical protein
VLAKPVTVSIGQLVRWLMTRLSSSFRSTFSSVTFRRRLLASSVALSPCCCNSLLLDTTRIR